MMNDEPLVMEHQPIVVHAPATNVRSILLHVQRDAGMQHRLQTALSLARATGAHLQCVHVTPIEAYVTMETWGFFTIDEAIAKIDDQEAQLRTELERRLAAEDVSWDYEQVAGHIGSEIIRRAALADLVVTGRNAHSARVQRPELAVLGDILMNLRTPLFIPGSIGTSIDLFGNAIVAWNGSVGSANAVRSAVGLLKLASAVRVIRFTEEKQPEAFPDTRLLEYLSRHGIHAELDVRTINRDLTCDLIETASAFGTAYIVMGGYSHSRAGEFLFGGMTRDVLRDCPIPLVMSH